MNTAIISGIPLYRWIISEVILIKKEPKNPQINKLRVVNKIETDYNLVLKFHWFHQATHYAKKMNHLGKNQRDTRLRRSVDTTALLHEIITEIHRLSFRSLTILHNDTEAYFDIMTKVTLRRRYKIQKIHDTSNKSFSHSSELSLHKSG